MTKKEEAEQMFAGGESCATWKPDNEEATAK
jgi:hypothetical protein